MLRSGLLNIMVCLGVFAGLAETAWAAPLVILNEYNAVGATQFLNGGKSDPAFGDAPVAGNGGSWFELLVIGGNPQSLTSTGTTVDMRGWTLSWQSQQWQNMDWQATAGGTNVGNTPQTLSGSLQLSQDPFWQTIRSGTIITFTANNLAQGGKDTDTGFDPAQGKWNVNIWAGESALVVTNGALLNTTGRQWQLTIKDGNGTVVFGPAGDGVGPKLHARPNKVFKLEEVRVETVTNAAQAHYTAGTTSTFGQLNQWGNGSSTEDASVVRAWAQQ